MAQKELTFKLKFVDENGALVEKTAQNIEEINKSIKDLTEELENTDLGSEQWQELAKDLGQAEYALEKTTEAINETKNAQKSLGDQLTAAPGIVGQVSNSVKGLSQTFKALLANPIVAVIAAITAALVGLYKAFTSTKEGGELVERVMTGLGAAFDVLRDRVLKVGSALVKFITGDFKGALEEAKGAVSGLGAEIASEFNQALAIKKELQNIADAQRDLNNERARQNTEIAKAKLIINDETKSYKERQEALEQVRQAEIALAKQEEILAQRRYEAIRAQNALSDSSKEALDEEAAAYQALQAAQLSSLQKQKELYDQQKALRDRERAEREAAAREREQQLQALFDLETQLNNELLKDVEEQALREVELNKRKLEEQVKQLKLSKEKEAELILKIEETTERKRGEIQTQFLNEAIGRLDQFRQVLIDQQKQSDQFVISNLERQLDGVDEAIQNMLEKGYQGYEQYVDQLTAIVSEASSLLGVDMMELADISFENYLSNGVDNIDAIIEKLTDAYKDYYQTLKFEAAETYNAQILSEEKLQEQRQKQLDDAKTLLDKGVIDQEDYRKREAEINEYFDDYNANQKELYNQRIAAIEQEQSDKIIEIKKKQRAVEEAIQKEEEKAALERIRLREAGFNVLIELAGEESKLGKALAIAQTTISTYEAAQAAYASQLTIPTPDAPVRAAVAAGIAVAQGLARVLAITNTNTELQAADGMVVGQGSGRMDNIPVRVSSGESIINARSTSMFKPLLSAINQAGGGRRFASGGITSMSTQASPETNLLNQISQISSNTPIKTYVVSTDVSSNQSLDRQIKSRSVL